MHSSIQIVGRFLRDFFAVLILLLGAAALVAVFVTPWLSESLWILRQVLLRQHVLVFCGLMCVAILLLGRKALRRPTLSMILAVVAAAVLLPFGVIFRAFGQVDMMSVMFHAKEGITGVGPTMLQNDILTTLGTLSGLLLICYLASAVAPLRHLPMVAAVLLVLGNPVVIFVAKRMLLPVPDVDLATRLVEPQIAANPLAPDIVYIYLEGMDRLFLDPELDMETANTLRALEKQGLSFTEIRQVAGTGWTIAGMVASQCGVPLLPRGFLNNDIIESVVERFLPGVTCLGDLLDGQGYQKTFVMGAEAKFAGTVAFYATHHYQTTIAQKDMKLIFPPEELAEASVVWFADDQMVYDATRKEFTAALGKDAPFLLTIATIGPHGVPNYLSRQCTGDGKATYTKDMFEAARCLMGLTAKLVADLQQEHRQSGRKNGLRFILQSDHLNHGRPLLRSTPKVTVNTLILIGGPEQGVTIAKPGTMLDVFPTVLDWLGFPAAGGKAGLGVSLLSPKAGETLVATWDVPVLDRIVMANMPMFQKLWEGSH
jgi:phosphoglycerol transferase